MQMAQIHREPLDMICESLNTWISVVLTKMPYPAKKDEAKDALSRQLKQEKQD